MKIRVAKSLLLGVSVASLTAPLVLMSGAAYAQSTGTQEVETVVVTESRIQTGGLMTPLDIPKERSIINKEYIDTQPAGQTVFDTLNTIPGFNFTNTDPYGNSGGNIRLHGMDGNRISLTWDGMPLNDTGNYATFTNQIVDTEVIDKVSVNQGTTDVDSPTASATGGVINITTARPADQFAVLTDLSYGSFDYKRGFIRLDTGEIGPWGTKAFFTFSKTDYDKFKGPGNEQKGQINADIYQDMGALGWINLAAHFNRNRNDFYNNVSYLGANALSAYSSAVLKTSVPNPSPLSGVLAVGAPNVALDANGDYTGVITPGTNVPLGGFGLGFDEDPTCTRPAPVNGTAQNEGSSSCTGFYRLRINPSDTGNIRGSSLWHITPDLTFTLDANFQYVLANGGGFTTLSEKDAKLRGPTQAVAGKDLNGDGDILDTIGFYTPNNTNTRRYGVNAQVIYQFDPSDTLQFAYVLDWGLHRQTGQWSTYNTAIGPADPFGGLREPTQRVLSVDGFDMKQRDRKSYAILNQFSLDYEGKFMDDRLRVSAGIRLPYFDRELHQNCYNQTTGFAYCTSENPNPIGANGLLTFNNVAGFFTPPGTETVHYSRALPNAGLTWVQNENNQFFITYAAGISVPRTDNLYNGGNNGNPACKVGVPAPAPCFYTTFATVAPETTQTYDLGYRFQNDWASASVTLWNTQYKNRIVTTFDPDQGLSVDHNIGTVNMDGIDLEGSATPMEDLNIYGSFSYIHSRVAAGPFSTLVPGSNPLVTVSIAGKEVLETPNFTGAGRIQYKIMGFRIGLGGKFVGRRYATDTNDYRVPSYFTANADITYDLGELGWESSYLKFNVANLFDQQYFGSVATSRNCFTPVAPVTVGCTSYPLLSVGAPRSFQIELRTVF